MTLPTAILFANPTNEARNIKSSSLTNIPGWDPKKSFATLVDLLNQNGCLVASGYFYSAHFSESKNLVTLQFNNRSFLGIRRGILSSQIPEVDAIVEKIMIIGACQGKHGVSKLSPTDQQPIEQDMLFFTFLAENSFTSPVFAISYQTFCRLVTTEAQGQTSLNIASLYDAIHSLPRLSSEGKQQITAMLAGRPGLQVYSFNQSDKAETKKSDYLFTHPNFKTTSIFASNINASSSSSTTTAQDRFAESQTNNIYRAPTAASSQTPFSQGIISTLFSRKALVTASFVAVATAVVTTSYYAQDDENPQPGLNL